MESTNCEKSEIINIESHTNADQDNDEIVTINVGGIRHDVTKKTLQRYPGTKLATLNNDDAAYVKSKNEFYFDRHPGLFNTILNIYRTGELHMENDVCGEVLKHELVFWKVDNIAFEKCCSGKFSETVGKKKQLLHFESKLRVVPPNSVHPSESGSVVKNGCWQKLRHKVWLVLDEPFSSIPAKVFGAWTAVIVLLSVATLCLETVPSLQQNMTSAEIAELVGMEEDDFLEYYDYELHNDVDYMDNTWELFDPEDYERVDGSGTADDMYIGAGLGEADPDSESAEYEDSDPDTEEGTTKKKKVVKIHGSLHVKNHVLESIDAVLYVYFAVELIARFIFCPNKLKFLISFHTICDILALLPGLILYIANLHNNENKYRISILDSMKSLLIMRVFRVFRLLRHALAYQVIIYTLRASAKEILLLIGLLLLAMLVFASLMYFGELINGHDKSDITSIPIACWYALVTMTTVGYGDFYPKSIGGYIVGSGCVICGVLVISFTVPIIVNNFMMYYTHAQSLNDDDSPNNKDANKHRIKDNNVKNITHLMDDKNRTKF